MTRKSAAARVAVCWVGALVCFSWPASPAGADVTLPFITTFDCGEWRWSTSTRDPGCDGMNRYLNGETPLGAADQITADADHPSGDGGRGFRHWIGTAPTTSDHYNGGGISIRFPPTAHVWLRYYQRFQSGFPATRWSHYKSALVFHGSSFFRFLTGYNTSRDLGLAPRSGTTAADVYWGHTVYSPAGSMSDGSWHAVEIEIDTVRDHLRYWINGELVFENLRAGLGAGTIHRVALGSNIKFAGTPEVDWYIDYDDVEISSSPSSVDAAGNPYIGLLCAGAGCPMGGVDGGVVADAGVDASVFDASADGSVPDGSAPDGAVVDSSTGPRTDAGAGGDGAPPVDGRGGDSSGGCGVVSGRSGGSPAPWWAVAAIFWRLRRRGDRGRSRPGWRHARGRRLTVEGPRRGHTRDSESPRRLRAHSRSGIDRRQRCRWRRTS